MLTRLSQILMLLAVTLAFETASAQPQPPPSVTVRPVFPPLQQPIVDPGPVAEELFNRLDLVSDEQTALAIAQAVLIPAYGAAKIRDEEPFKVWRVGDKWLVDGTRQIGMCLSAKDGRVLGVFRIFREPHGLEYFAACE